MELNETNILFSDLATKKLNDCDRRQQKKILDFISMLSERKYLDIIAEKFGDDFYSVPINQEARIVFSIDSQNIFVTDILFGEQSKNFLPDYETLNYYQRIAPGAARNMMKRMNEQIDKQHKLMARISLYKQIGLCLHVIVLVFSFIFGVALAISTGNNLFLIVALCFACLFFVFEFLRKRRTRQAKK